MIIPANPCIPGVTRDEVMAALAGSLGQSMIGSKPWNPLPYTLPDPVSGVARLEAEIECLRNRIAALEAMPEPQDGIISEAAIKAEKQRRLDSEHGKAMRQMRDGGLL